MTRYVAVAEEQVPLGRPALLLFVHDAHLCAGTIEHRYDGRIVRRLPEAPDPGNLIAVISQLIASQGQTADLFVVLDPGAYWPEPFPVLNGLNSHNYSI